MIPARKPLPFPATFVAAALALPALACSEPAGLRVDVNLGAFKDALSLEIVIAADPGGFVKQGAENAGGATVTTEDVDGDGTYDLVTKFNGPFPSGSVSFLVTTGNRDALTMHGQALAFDAASLRAGAEGDAPLPAGGRGTLALTLEARPPGPIGPGTRSTDLLTAPANVTINGPSMDAQASAIAVCDLNGDKKQDVVIGVPGAAPNTVLGPTGAVYVVFGDGGATETITLAPGDQSQFLFYGLDGGDRLGAAVACADLDADGVDDLIVGAPNAAGGVGRVYVVLGRSGLNLRSIDLASPTSDHLPDATWTATGANAGFGAALFALDFDADNRAEILVSAPGGKKVHLLTHLPTTTAPVDADQPDHPTFSGVQATALSAGDLDGMGNTPDVILGDPTYIATNETTSRGIVYLFANVAPATPTAFDVTATDQTGPTTTMVGDKGTGFGAAVLALDTTGYQPDLFVGAPNAGADGRGLVYVYEHQDTFFLAKTRSITEFKTMLDGGVPGAHFGSALGASRSGAKAAPSWRLLVGAPDAPRGARTGAGAAYLLGGGVARGFPVLELVYGAAAGDRLGTAVAGGQIDAADSIGDLVTVSPFATGADTRSGVVYVQFGRP